MSGPGRYTADKARPADSLSNSPMATTSTSRPSVERASTSRFSTTSAPGHGPEAHQPTASAGRPAEAATSQKARLRLSQADTGARKRFFKAGAAIGDGAEQGAFALGMYIIGRASHSARVAALGADLVAAQIVNGVLTQGLKFTVTRTRPNGSSHSFPSGHTSATFATAAVIHEHYGWKVAAPFYALGGYVSASRMVDNQHFASDVIFGAALGIVAGRAASVGHGLHRISVSPTLLPRGFAVAGSIGN